MEELSKLIGIKIRDLRHQKDITQEALAYMADVDRTYMNGIENGRRNISVVVLNKLITALGISLSDFFNDAIFITILRNKNTEN
jgi:transcriptional regulator with XRE-family HTH domain